MKHKIIKLFTFLVFIPSLSLAQGGGLSDQFVRAGYLFHTNRYSNAEVAFKSLVKSKKTSERDSREYYMSLYYLAMSKSEQGKTKGVREIFKEYVELGTKLFGIDSFETAKNYLNMGEVFYREGKAKEAMYYLGESERIYSSLPVKPEGFLEFIELNKKEYSSGKFDKSKLREDFSEFYTACESLEVEVTYPNVRKKLKRYSEAEVDFQLDGMFEGMFSAKLINESGTIPEHDRRTIFIPRNDTAVYDEWCIVYLKDSKVVGVDLSES